MSPSMRHASPSLSANGGSASFCLQGFCSVADCRDDFVEAFVKTRKVGIGHALGDCRVEEVAGDGAQWYFRMERTGQFDRHRYILLQIVDTRAGIPLFRQDMPGETHLADEAASVRDVEDIDHIGKADTGGLGHAP